MNNLRKKADKLWSKVIRVLSGYNPNDRTVDPHHVMVRANNSTRFDIANGFLLSRVDHSYYEDHPEQAEIFFREKLGDVEYSRLEQKSLLVKKWQPVELEEIIRQFNEILKGETR